MIGYRNDTPIVKFFHHFCFFLVLRQAPTTAGKLYLSIFFNSMINKMYFFSLIIYIFNLYSKS